MTLRTILVTVDGFHAGDDLDDSTPEGASAIARYLALGGSIVPKSQVSSLAIALAQRARAGVASAADVALGASALLGLPVAATFVVKPGVTPGGNQFADFASAWAAAATITGPKVLQFDDTGGAIDIGPGVYDPTDWIFEGLLRGGATDVIVNMLEGAQFTRPPTIIRYGLRMLGKATATPNILMGAADVVILQDGGIIAKDPAATAPVMLVQPGAGPDGPLVACIIGGVLGSGNADVEVAAGAAGLTVILDVLGTLPNDSLTGAGAANVIITNASAINGITLPPTQSGLAAVQYLDITLSGLGVRQWWSCESAPCVAAKEIVPPGYALSTTTNEMGVRALRNELMSQLILTYAGNAANAGLTVLVEVRVNDVPVPGASFVLDASLPGSFGFAAFNGGVSAGTDYVTLTLTPSAPLVAPLTQINASLG